MAIRVISKGGQDEPASAIDDALAYLARSDENAVLALCTYPLGRLLVETTRKHRETMDRVAGQVTKLNVGIAKVSKSVVLCKNRFKDEGSYSLPDLAELQARQRSFDHHHHLRSFGTETERDRRWSYRGPDVATAHCALALCQMSLASGGSQNSLVYQEAAAEFAALLGSMQTGVQLLASNLPSGQISHIHGRCQDVLTIIFAGIRSLPLHECTSQEAWKQHQDAMNTMVAFARTFGRKATGDAQDILSKDVSDEQRKCFTVLQTALTVLPTFFDSEIIVDGAVAADRVKYINELVSDLPLFLRIVDYSKEEAEQVERYVQQTYCELDAPGVSTMQQAAHFHVGRNLPDSRLISAPGPCIPWALQSEKGPTSSASGTSLIRGALFMTHHSCDFGVLASLPGPLSAPSLRTAAFML